MIFRIKSKIYREIARLFKYRPASYPYISGDGFRSVADHIYDETGKCKPRHIRNDDIVFLKSDLVKEWFANIHPKIDAKYKLITHNSDSSVGENEARFIDDKIIRWFAQNNTFKHDKISPIPIGLENISLYMSGWVFYKMVPQLKKEEFEKKQKILFGFNTNTNVAERTLALLSLRACPVAEEIPARLNARDYFQLLNQYAFIASPEGNGADCHRTWEAVILDIIPVTSNSSSNQILTESKFPILLINDWTELRCMTEIGLREISNRYEFPSNSDITMLNYWVNIIRNSK